MPLFKKALFLSMLLLLQAGAGILGTAVILENRYTGVIQQGVTVKGVPVGGLNAQEAAQKLENALPFPAECCLRIENAGKNHSISLADIDGRYDYLATAAEALHCGNTEKNFSQLMDILRLRAAPADLAVKIAFSGEKLSQRIKQLQEEWDAPPRNAALMVLDEKVVVIAEKSGYSLDFEKTLEQARRALADGSLHAQAAGRILEPEINSAALEGIDTLLAEYTTSFDSSAANRSHNIALASSAVNGTLLKPGEIFSLNQRLGPRLAEKGYLNAPVFVGDRLDLDIGGGVCQVATTLYNAVLLADLPVLERTSHPLAVSYVAPGRDATIAGDYLDLKFANNMDTPVYISSQVDTGTLTVRIFGAGKNKGRTVRINTEKKLIEPKVIVIQDNALPEGETRVINPGKAGYEARVYREVVVDGRVESRNLISTDYYKPVDKVVHVGPRPKEAEK
ncbi:MAG: VanW family protein [Peptococcaceae bacterium]|nr:VanW family protein [Peptococcaceae bacterium]